MKKLVERESTDFATPRARAKADSIASTRDGSMDGGGMLKFMDRRTDGR